MVMFDIAARETGVVADRAGRPRAVRAGGRRHVVTECLSVRDETAAYPATTGPRTVFMVAAGGQRYRLVFLWRDRRWCVEPASPEGLLAQAA